ncbi:MAG: xanthine dehydrogenase family protein [Candidatus Rokubacteria bacterium]|nr:xanthine dehydrogenase family protein [Candidatus Rokubacteria bacterium]
MSMAPARKYVSARIKRVEDPPLLMGKARYLSDITLGGMLTVGFVRSPHAHARIVRIDARAALAMPGVEAVLTGEQVRAFTQPIRAEMSGASYRSTDWAALAWPKARFVGEPVAAVVASDRYRVEDALDAVVVEYEPLPPVVDAEAAMTADAPRLHEQHPDNIIIQARYDNGETDRAFADAAITLRTTFRHGRCTSAPMEGRGVVASWDAADGTLTVWASTQAPHFTRAGLAAALDLPESRIRVIAPAIGGGFGPKMHVYPEDVTVCALARRLGRPVKWLEDRRENLLTSAQAREFVAQAEVAADRDGTILAFRATFICDVGAYSVYPTTAALEPMTAAGIMPGPYRLRGYSYEAYGVATNKCPTGAYRGVGMAFATFVRERLVDMVAAACAVDPADVRRRSFFAQKDTPYTTASGIIVDSADPAGSLASVLDAAGYDGLRAEQRAAGNGRLRRGIGLCAYTEFTGMGSGTFRRRGMTQVSGYDAATVRVEPTGEVRAFLSAASQGQGHATTFAQVLADELGVPLAAVTIIEGDTERCPHGSGSFASRSMVVSGGALILAARKVRDKTLTIAAHMLEAAATDLVIDDGRIAVRGMASRAVTLADVARLAYRPASGTLPPGVDPALEATHHYDPPPATFSNGTHLAVVDVDIETGEVRIVRYVVGEDCGTMVNPMIVEGQLHGAVAQGIGNALYERIVHDDGGQPLTTSFMDYLLPTTMELPSVEVVHSETPPPGSVSGFKGMAEGGTIGAASAVANAVADALAPLGVEVRELPLAPDVLHRLIARAARDGTRA